MEPPITCLDKPNGTDWYVCCLRHRQRVAIWHGLPVPVQAFTPTKAPVAPKPVPSLQPLAKMAKGAAKPCNDSIGKIAKELLARVKQMSMQINQLQERVAALERLGGIPGEPWTLDLTPCSSADPYANQTHTPADDAQSTTGSTHSASGASGASTRSWVDVLCVQPAIAAEPIPKPSSNESWSQNSRWWQ